MRKVQDKIDDAKAQIARDEATLADRDWWPDYEDQVEKFRKRREALEDHIKIMEELLEEGITEI